MGSPIGVTIVVVGVVAALLFLVFRHRSKKSLKKKAPKKDSQLRGRIRTHLMKVGRPDYWILYEFIENLPPENRERERAVIRAVCMRLDKGRRVATAEIRALTKILQEDLKFRSYSVTLPRKADRKK